MKPLLKKSTPTNREVTDTDLNGHSNEDSLSVSAFKTLETDDEPPSDMETGSTRSYILDDIKLNMPFHKSQGWDV